MARSEMVPVGEVGNISSLVDILWYNIGKFPLSYLGRPSKPCWCGISSLKK